MENVNIPTMLTIKQTAEKTHLSETYLRRLSWKNEICFVRSGKKYLINLEKLCDYLNNHVSYNQK